MSDPMETLRELRLRTAGVTPRIEQLQGREHLVVPVVALMEGVIHAVNAEVPEYVTPEFLAMAAESWNGRPCVLGHPTENGRQISANDPRIANTHEFGKIYKSALTGSRLAMEAWIDPARLEALGEQQMLADLRAGKPIEVSVGASVRTSPTAGTFNGKAYQAKWVAGLGDHLAFLPRGKGACSVEMGCGACRAAEAVPEYEITDQGWQEIRGARDISQAERDAGDAGDFAGPHRSFPIFKKADVSAAASSIGRGKNPDAIKRRIIAIAKRKGWTSELPQKWQDEMKGASMNLRERLTAFASSVRLLSNPEGINQYSKGGGGSGIQNPNSSGQGHDPSHADNKFHDTLTSHGFTYSHSTPVTHPSGVTNHHTYKNGDRNVSVYKNPATGNQVWESSKSGSGRSTGGTSADKLDSHLSNVVRKSAQVYDTPEEAASEEAAELVGYQTLRSHLDAIENALGDASGIVDDLISDETEDPTETAAQEDAEEEVETARIEALMSLLGLMGSAAGNAMSVCMNLNAPDPEDLPAPSDPRYGYLEARAAAGKEISSKNMKTIQAAHDAAHTMHDHTTNLGAQCNGMRLLSGESTMTKQEKDGLIKSFTECEDLPAQSDPREAEAKLKAAAEKPVELTEAEVMAKFPSIKALVDEAQATKAARKEALVSKLKAAQAAYSEEELKGLELPALEKLALVAKVDAPQPDYSGRGLASSKEPEKQDYTPPDPYEAGLKKYRESLKVN